MTNYNMVRWEKTQLQADQWRNEAFTKADDSMKIVLKEFLRRLVSEEYNHYKLEREGGPPRELSYESIRTALRRL